MPAQTDERSVRGGGRARAWRSQIEEARQICRQFLRGEADLDALSVVAPVLIDSIYADEFTAVLDQLPEREVATRAGLALAKGRQCSVLGERDRSRSWYATACASARPDRTLQARAFFELACVALAENQVASAEVTLDAATVALGPLASSCPDLLHLRALVVERRRGTFASRDDYRRAIALGDNALTLVTRVHALRNLASGLAHDEPHSATGLCALALALVDGDALDQRVRPSVENVLAYALICDGNIHAARSHALAAARDASRLGHPLVETYARFNGAIASELLGDLEEAERTLSELAESGTIARYEELLGWIRLRQAWLATKRGRSGVAAEQVAHYFAQSGASAYDSAVGVLRGILDLGEGHFTEAIARLQSLVQRYSDEGDWLTAFVILLWLVSAHRRDADRANAQAALRAAIEIGEPRGFRVSPNWWSDEVVEEAREVAGPDQRSYVERLLRTQVPVAVRHSPEHIRLSRDGTIRIDGEPLPDAQWRRGRTGSRVLRRLFAALVSAHPVGLGREDLADHLWPESDGDRALQNLDSALNDLRRLLAGVGGMQVVIESSRYRLSVRETVAVEPIADSTPRTDVAALDNPTVAGR